MRNFFICFIGIDGSGKTTLVRTLLKVMNSYGIKAKYVRNRFEPNITKPFMVIAKALFFNNKNISDCYNEYSYTKKKLFKNKSLSTIYQYFVLADYFIQFILKLQIPKMLDRNIICDRYVYDTIADIASDLNLSDRKIENVLKYLLYFMPKPDLIFLIDVPEGIAYQRKQDIPSIDYLRDRRRIYLNIAMNDKIIVLDGSKDLKELEVLIQDEVFRVIAK